MLRSSVVVLCAVTAVSAAQAQTPQHGTTVEVPSLSAAGAQVVLTAAEAQASRMQAPSSIAVVDAAGDLLAFVQMDGARRAGIDLAMGKARSALRFHMPTEALEATINGGRAAAITAGAVEMQGGVPVTVDGTMVGAIGVSGMEKHNDVQIAQAAVSSIR